MGIRQENRPSVAELAQAFIAKHRSKATRRAYRSDLLHLGRFLTAEPKPSLAVAAEAALACRVGSVVEWRDEQERVGARPASVARRLASLRSFFRFAQACGLRQDNPAVLVESPRVEARLQRAPVLTAKAAGRLLEAPDTSTTVGLRDRAIVGLLGCSGLRRAEVSRIRLGDVLEDASGLRIRVVGKGGRVRVVDVDPNTAEALCGYLRAEGRSADSETAGAPLFHSSRDGGRASRPLALGSINALVARYANAAEVEADAGAAAPHALRRTFATVALDRGATLETLRRALGHADPKTTARYDRARKSSLVVSFEAA